MAKLYKGNEYDLICYPGYMFAAFSEKPSIDASGIMLAQTLLTTNSEIVSMGEHKSAGWSKFEVTEPSFIRFVGCYVTAKNDTLILFDTFANSTKKINDKATGYAAVYLAFYKFMNDGEMLFITQSNASRVVTPVFQFRATTNN